jgi:hypothetical protein
MLAAVTIADASAFHGVIAMRKYLIAALLALTVAGGVVAFGSIEKPTPAHADCQGGC